jgi:hypothetical protein
LKVDFHLGDRDDCQGRRILVRWDTNRIRWDSFRASSNCNFCLT